MSASIGPDPLGRVDPLDSERTTDSGIILAQLDEAKQFPFIQCQTDVQGYVFNIAGPELEDLEHAAEVIATAQLHAEAGSEALLWIRDPFLGSDLAITPAGLRRILSVSRAYASKVDPIAAKRTIAIPRNGHGR